MHFKWKVTIEHEYKIGVALLESVMKFHIGRHLAVKSLWRHLKTPLTVHFGQKVTVEHEYKVGVALPESGLKFHIGRSLAVKLLWRHFWEFRNVIISY